MARPARPERSRLARSRQLSRFYHSINPDRVFGTHSSFSAAGRRLGRAQSVVSQTLAHMEGQLGIRLFDRSKRIPVLTEAGRALLPDARAVTGNIDSFKARARGLA